MEVKKTKSKRSLKNKNSRKNRSKKIRGGSWRSGIFGSKKNPSKLEELTQENQTLKEQNQTLTQENQTLTKENQTLTQENQTLTKENQTLTTENQILKEQNQTLIKEKQTLNVKVYKSCTPKFELKIESSLISDTKYRVAQINNNYLFYEDAYKDSQELSEATLENEYHNHVYELTKYVFNS